MRLRWLSALGALGVLAALLAVSASGAPAATSAGKKLYIVQLVEPPAAGYEGGIAGYERTKPAKGKKFDSGTQAAKRYRGYLEQRHDEVLDDVSASAVAEYTASFNGFAAELTEAQADRLRTSKSVLAVSENEYVELDTTSTPAFLGLDKPKSQGGLWDVLGGTGKGGVGRGAGEDVIVGIVDSGIWPENPSFSARKLDGSNGNAYPHKVSGWYGTCQTGEAWTAADCNGKIIGARYFREGYSDEQLREADFVSPRDHDGHGSHVASTAAGNHGVQATGDAAPFGKLSGMAPRARIAVYKVCWPSCATVDTVAGIDAAVADGVDVLNYSISGTTTAFTNPVEVAFLFAAEAGVYVSASAGNSGPGASTVAHPSPWITTTAAGTHNRDGKGTLTVGAVTFNGASSAATAVTGVLLNADSAGKAGAAAADVLLCTPGTLDPAKVTGKIVVCDRGVIGRIDKSRAVKDAGGIGMVQVNTSANSINADLHFVPSIHLPHTDRAAVRALEGSSATISKGTIVYDAAAPFTASFSSRGPSLAAGGDVLKPDIIAPGQDIMAAVAPPGNYGRDFDLYSGTSMSSPHMTGLGALLKQARPSWSPMMIKSAFMTTSYQSNDYSPFGWGAGHVDPNKAIDPGLVLDSGMGDWLAFLKGQGLYTGPGPSLRAIDLNTPSIAISRLAGNETVPRTYTSVGSQSESYTVSFQGLPGVNAAASPSSFTAAPGSATKVEYTFTRTTAALNAYTTGFAVLTGDKGHVVKIPVVLRPVPLATPAEVSTTGNSVSWTVKTGYDGVLAATVRGLVAATETAWTVAQDPDQTFTLGDMTGTFKHTVTIPANTTFRTGIYEDAIAPTGTDLDLFVYVGSSLVGASADGDSNEEVTLRTGGGSATVDIYVHGWSTNGPSASGTLFTWLANADAGNVTLSGIGPATTAATQTHTATFSGLTPGRRYLGEVRYNNGSAVIGQTLISVRP